MHRGHFPWGPGGTWVVRYLVQIQSVAASPSHAHMGFLPPQGGWGTVHSECRRQGRSQIQGQLRALDGQLLTLSVLVSEMPRAGSGLCPVSQEGQVLDRVSHSVVSDSATPWSVPNQAPLSMGFPRQEYWSGLPFPSPGDLPDPGIKPASLTSPALAGRFFTN